MGGDKKKKKKAVVDHAYMNDIVQITESSKVFRIPYDMLDI